MKTIEVEVTMRVRVQLDDTKFDEKFMQEFREIFYDFASIEDHAKHIAQLFCRHLLSKTFIEGYGPPNDMGISIAEPDIIDMETVEKAKPILPRDFMAYP